MMRHLSTLAVQLNKWFVFSVVIPAFAIFVRWLVLFAGVGPDQVDPSNMMRASEVSFLAAAIIAEALGDAPDAVRGSPDGHMLTTARTLLIVLLILSLLIFAALIPLAESPHSTDFIPWLVREGRGFHASLNTIILVSAILTCLGARFLYWAIEISQEVKPSEVKETGPSQVEKVEPPQAKETEPSRAEEVEPPQPEGTGPSRPEESEPSRAEKVEPPQAEETESSRTEAEEAYE